MISRLIVDFGLVVLIWLVQLVIYPAFKFYTAEDLQKWHKMYTARIALVVVPLMTAQLLIAGYQLWLKQDLYTGLSMIIIIALWILTFRIFVPLHSSIAEDPTNSQNIHDLIKKNWIRTFLWTGLFLWTLGIFLVRH